MTYIVIENAGYDGERDIKSFYVFRAALNYMRTHYDDDEIDSLHVAICRESNGERSYEI